MSLFTSLHLLRTVLDAERAVASRVRDPASADAARHDIAAAAAVAAAEDAAVEELALATLNNDPNTTTNTFDTSAPGLVALVTAEDGDCDVDQGPHAQPVPPLVPSAVPASSTEDARPASTVAGSSTAEAEVEAGKQPSVVAAACCSFSVGAAVESLELEEGTARSMIDAAATESWETHFHPTLVAACAADAGEEEQMRLWVKPVAAATDALASAAPSVRGALPNLTQLALISVADEPQCAAQGGAGRVASLLSGTSASSAADSSSGHAQTDEAFAFISRACPSLALFAMAELPEYDQPTCDSANASAQSTVQAQPADAGPASGEASAAAAATGAAPEEARPIVSSSEKFEAVTATVGAAEGELDSVDATESAQALVAPVVVLSLGAPRELPPAPNVARMSPRTSARAALSPPPVPSQQPRTGGGASGRAPVDQMRTENIDAPPSLPPGRPVRVGGARPPSPYTLMRSGSGGGFPTSTTAATRNAPSSAPVSLAGTPLRHAVSAELPPAPPGTSLHDFIAGGGGGRAQRQPPVSAGRIPARPPSAPIAPRHNAPPGATTGVNGPVAGGNVAWWMRLSAQKAPGTGTTAATPSVRAASGGWNLAPAGGAVPPLAPVNVGAPLAVMGIAIPPPSGPPTGRGVVSARRAASNANAAATREAAEPSNPLGKPTSVAAAASFYGRPLSGRRPLSARAAEVAAKLPARGGGASGRLTNPPTSGASTGAVQRPLDLDVSAHDHQAPPRDDALDDDDDMDDTALVNSLPNRRSGAASGAAVVGQTQSRGSPPPPPTSALLATAPPSRPESGRAIASAAAASGRQTTAAPPQQNHHHERSPIGDTPPVLGMLARVISSAGRVRPGQLAAAIAAGGSGSSGNSGRTPSTRGVGGGGAAAGLLHFQALAAGGAGAAGGASGGPRSGRGSAGNAGSNAGTGRVGSVSMLPTSTSATTSAAAGMPLVNTRSDLARAYGAETAAAVVLSGRRRSSGHAPAGLDAAPATIASGRTAATGVVVGSAGRPTSAGSSARPSSRAAAAIAAAEAMGVAVPASPVDAVSTPPLPAASATTPEVAAGPTSARSIVRRDLLLQQLNQPAPSGSRY